MGDVLASGVDTRRTESATGLAPNQFLRPFQPTSEAGNQTPFVCAGRTPNPDPFLKFYHDSICTSDTGVPSSTS
jgi:hypothetical protein